MSSFGGPNNVWHAALAQPAQQQQSMMLPGLPGSDAGAQQAFQQQNSQVNTNIAQQQQAAQKQQQQAAMMQQARNPGNPNAWTVGGGTYTAGPFNQRPQGNQMAQAPQAAGSTPSWMRNAANAMAGGAPSDGQAMLAGVNPAARAAGAAAGLAGGPAGGQRQGAISAAGSRQASAMGAPAGGNPWGANVHSAMNRTTGRLF